MISRIICKHFSDVRGGGGGGDGSYRLPMCLKVKVTWLKSKDICTFYDFVEGGCDFGELFCAV